VLAAPQDADLTQSDAWTFSNHDLIFEDVLREPSLMGAPRFPYGPLAPFSLHDKRYNAPAGWLEANLVRIVDPNHIWHRRDGVRLHVFLRSHLGGVSNLAALCQADESTDGSITTSLVKTPAGQTQGFLPFPGGHLKFHIDYDAVSKLYWLVCNRCTDSMIRPDRMPADRYNIPLNQRDKLDLYFSSNAVDWVLAGRVAESPAPDQPRNYPSLAFAGDDLYVLSRSGDENAANAHNGNFISFHVVKDFRALIY